MQLRFGSHSFDANSVFVQTEVETLFNEADQPYCEVHRWQLRGWLKGTGQADLTTKQLALQTAMRRTGQDLVLYRDDGSPSATILDTRTSISGVKITRGPSFGGTVGSEYVTEREFAFEAVADYPLPNTGAVLRSFTESLTFSGGGPRYNVRDAVEGPTQRQKLYAATAYRCVQSGQAVGYQRLPTVPPPIWPQWIVEAPNYTPVSPRRRGRGYQDYAVSWSYNFAATEPLVGLPTLWRG